MPKDGVECESFLIISIDFLLVYENKYYLRVYSVYLYKYTSIFRVLLCLLIIFLILMKTILINDILLQDGCNPRN